MAAIIATAYMAVKLIERYVLVIELFIIVPMVISILLSVVQHLNTYYLLDKDELIVKSGILAPTKISYGSIRNMRKTWSLLASQSLTINCIEITFVNSDMGVLTYDIVRISPQNEDEFLHLLEEKMQNKR